MITLTWYGQAGFRVASAQARILIDPFLSEREGRAFPPTAGPEDFGDIDLVLCTHEHIDHMDMGFLPALCAVNDHVRIAVPAPVIGLAADGGVPRDRLIAAEPGTVVAAPGVTACPLPALHGLGGDKPVVYEFLDGRFLGYVVETGGVRMYHAGDGLVYPELPGLLKEHHLDVLMLPINGRDFMREAQGLVGNMNEYEAAWLSAEVRPRYVIPMHYDMFGHNRGDIGRFAGRLHAIAADGGPALIMPARTVPIDIAPYR